MPTRSRPQRRSSYHSPLRVRQAAETRRTVVAAAGRLFSARGWAGTTLAAVAGEAGTAIETVYAGFGSKVGVLLAAIDAAIVGDDEVPISEQPRFAALGVGARSERLAAAARLITLAFSRAVPLMRALQEASASEETARARLDEYETDRRSTIAAGLGLVLGSPPHDELVDSMWALASPDVFIKLTQERAWDVDRYERWLVRTAAATLAAVEP